LLLVVQATTTLLHTQEQVVLRLAMAHLRKTLLGGIHQTTRMCLILLKVLVY
jgi:hypothetical protein